MNTNIEELLMSKLSVVELPALLLGTVTVPKVKVKLAVLNGSEVSGVDAEVGIGIAVDEATGGPPELRVSMTVKVLVSTT